MTPFQLAQGREFSGEVGSDAVWFKPPRQHEGGDLQNLVVDVLKNFIPSQGFDIHRDVQVRSQPAFRFLTCSSCSGPNCRSEAHLES